MSTRTAKTWRLLPHDRAGVERLAASLQLGPIVAQLLFNRGVTGAAEARRFLESPLCGLHPPDLLPGIPQAAERILAAAQAGRRICVYGDYDVDGITGTAILLGTLRLLGATPEVYVPHRLEEGYGLNAEALRQIVEAGASMIVTVDCGIASLEEAEQAKCLGLELIVTDHHEFKDTLPQAAVLVHPRLPGASYPFGKLSGAAVAFKLAWALAQRACGSAKVTPRFRDFLLEAVGLAALGIVADVVPLYDENRILVRHGLQRLRQTALPGLRALFACAGLTPGAALRASDVGYKIAPRLNAAGRLGCARLVIDLLTTTNEEQALQLARYLEEQNAQRQTIERRMVLEARKMIEEQGRGGDPALVLAGSGWHGGVIGIVAGRLAELYARPALMIALPTADGDGLHARVGVGSGRSIPGFALHEALRACGDLLLGHGGHAAAAGLRILPEYVDAFRARLCDYAAAHFHGGPPVPELTLDAEVPLSALTYGLLDDLDRLEPYGADNRRPLFLAGGLRVQGEPRKIGGGERHLSFRVSQQGTTLRAIAWSMADRAEELMSAGGACCLAFTPRRNEWQGYSSIDLEVVDFQTGAEARRNEVVAGLDSVALRLLITNQEPIGSAWGQMMETETRDRWQKGIVRGLGWWLAVGVWTAGLLTSSPAQVGKEVIPLGTYLPVSKLLHVAAYAFLAFCLPWIASRRWRWPLLAFLSLHAAGTEYLQQFVPGRTGLVSDVVIDHIGLLLALALTWKHWLPRTHASRPTLIASEPRP